ncbi:hypothetical protein C0J52_09317 [Blattella germanica]|nr:hypothetical protein C0J52_09317 [Blattella germanica]
MKRVAGLNLLDQVSNNDIRNSLEIFNLNERITDNKERWHAHIQRMDPDRLTKKLLNYRPQGYRYAQADSFKKKASFANSVDIILVIKERILIIPMTTKINLLIVPSGVHTITSTETIESKIDKEQWEKLESRIVPSPILKQQQVMRGVGSRRGGCRSSGFYSHTGHSQTYVKVSRSQEEVFSYKHTIAFHKTKLTVHRLPDFDTAPGITKTIQNNQKPKYNKPKKLNSTFLVLYCWIFYKFYTARPEHFFSVAAPAWRSSHAHYTRYSSRRHHKTKKFITCNLYISTLLTYFVLSHVNKNTKWRKKRAAWKIIDFKEAAKDNEREGERKARDETGKEIPHAAGKKHEFNLKQLKQNTIAEEKGTPGSVCSDPIYVFNLSLEPYKTLRTLKLNKSMSGMHSTLLQNKREKHKTEETINPPSKSKTPHRGSFLQAPPMNSSLTHEKILTWTKRQIFMGKTILERKYHVDVLKSLSYMSVSKKLHSYFQICESHSMSRSVFKKYQIDQHVGSASHITKKYFTQRSRLNSKFIHLNFSSKGLGQDLIYIKSNFGKLPATITKLETTGLPLVIVEDLQMSLQSSCGGVAVAAKEKLENMLNSNPDFGKLKSIRRSSNSNSTMAAHMCCDCAKERYRRVLIFYAIVATTRLT